MLILELEHLLHHEVLEELVVRHEPLQAVPHEPQSTHGRFVRGTVKEEEGEGKVRRTRKEAKGEGTRGRVVTLHSADFVNVVDFLNNIVDFLHVVDFLNIVDFLHVVNILIP